MFGPVKTRRLDEPITVSLNDLVPAGHFYRHLEATLDLGFVREWTRELYADRGRPGIDPIWPIAGISAMPLMSRFPTTPV